MDNSVRHVVVLVEHTQYNSDGWHGLYLYIVSIYGKVHLQNIQILTLRQPGLHLHILPVKMNTELSNSFRTQSTVTPVVFSIEMHFWALWTAGLKSNKKLSVHLFEAGGSITLASLVIGSWVVWTAYWCCLRARACVFVCACVARCPPFLFSHTMVFIAGAIEMRPMPLVFIRRLFSIFLPGCSSLSLSSPLNYYVCAHCSVTLNRGFNMLSDGQQRGHVCWSDIWQALTLGLKV